MVNIGMVIVPRGEIMVPDRLRVLFQEDDTEKTASSVPSMISDSQLLVKKDENDYSVVDPRHVNHDWFIRLMMTCHNWINMSINRDFSWCEQVVGHDGFSFDTNSSLPGKLQWAVRALYRMEVIKLPNLTGKKFMYITQDNASNGDKQLLRYKWDGSGAIKNYCKYYNMILFIYNHGVPGNRDKIESDRKTTKELVKLYKLRNLMYINPFYYDDLELCVRQSYINDNLILEMPNV